MDAKYYATLIVEKLVKAGYIAYFAGGWARDYVMGHPSSDIDIATNAPPEKILDLFPHTILVGLAFGVIIVVIEGHQFEVATFRRDIDYQGGRRPSSVELAEPEEDALRRDFTINGMFYDPLEERIIDYVGGMEDIKKRVVRTIGNPDERFSEDRLRMIRAVRFAARLDFAIDQGTQEGIQLNADTLFPAVAMERVWQEFNKMAAYPKFDQALMDMHRLRLLPVIFPVLEQVHLNDIRQRVAAFSAFPHPCPTLFYLLELFPFATVEEQVALCHYLKTSTKDMELVEFLYSYRKKINEEMLRLNSEEFHEWGHMYAHPKSSVCLEVIAARLPPAQRQVLLETHRSRQHFLAPHVERIALKKPLVNAAILQRHGVLPGKNMGKLLKEAERIAINYDIHEPDEIINKLKQTPIWPEV